MTKGRARKNFNTDGVIIEVRIRDVDYRVIEKGRYSLKKQKELYHLLLLIEKYGSHTINSVINGQKWF